MALPASVPLMLDTAINKLMQAKAIAVSDDPNAGSKVLNKIAEVYTPIRKAENIAGGH